MATAGWRFIYAKASKESGDFLYVPPYGHSPSQYIENYHNARSFSWSFGGKSGSVSFAANETVSNSSAQTSSPVATSVLFRQDETISTGNSKFRYLCVLQYNETDSTKRVTDGTNFASVTVPYDNLGAWYFYTKVYEKYDVKKSIWFRTDMGSTPDPIHDKFGGDVITLPTITSSAPFLGWYYGDVRVGGGGDSFTVPEGTSETIWLTAKWNAVAVTFQGNGGTPSSQTVLSEPGSRLNLPSVSWGSYRFLGWYDGNTRVGGIGDAYTTPSTDKTLVAKWFKYVSGGDITFNFILNSGVQFNNDQPVNPTYSSKVVGSYEIYISDDNRYCINWSVDTSEFVENGRKYTYILECKCAWTRNTADSQYFGTKTLSGNSGSGVDLSEVGFSSFAANVYARFRTVYGDSLRYVESGYLAYNSSSGKLRYGKQYAVDPIVPHP